VAVRAVHSELVSEVPVGGKITGRVSPFVDRISNRLSELFTFLGSLVTSTAER
jgi:hypothetical protein